MDQCAKKQNAICAKCGKNVLLLDLQRHREQCSPYPCPHCKELTIGRVMKYCPKQLLSRHQDAVGPFSIEHFKNKFLNKGGSTAPGVAGASAPSPLAEANMQVARIQHLFRWAKIRSLTEDVIFRLISKEMDLKKEGFAIFKAHDAKEEGLVHARTRSALQAPAQQASSADHFFPAKSGQPITSEHIRLLIGDLTNHKLLPFNAAWRVMTDTMNHLNTLPNIVRLTPPSSAGARIVNGRWHQGGKVVVVGDVHGQLADLLHILNENGMPSESTFYVFNGDFVDRGPYGVEVILILFSLMLAFPKFVALNRGNHECDYMNEEYGFDVEVSTKYDRNLFKLIQRCFCALPLATMIGSKVFVVHGGLPRRKGVTLEEIGRIQRFRQVPMPEHSQPEEDEIFQDLLWSDPAERAGWQESERGAGVTFGPDVTRDFLELNGLELVIRSHEEFPKGYEEHHNGKLITIFSASNYDGEGSNMGAFVVLAGETSEPSYTTYQVYEDEFDNYDFDTVDQTKEKEGAVHRPNAFGALTRVGQKRRRFKEEVLRALRERIYQRRHRLLSYFSKLDRSLKGTVWKMEFVETMRSVLNLDLPWFFLRRYLVEEDKDSRIQYVAFLHKFRSPLAKLWLNEWEKDTIQNVIAGQKMSIPILKRSFKQDTIGYNDFCTGLRDIDHTLSEAALFHLFLYFDLDLKGSLSAKAVIDEVNAQRDVPYRPPRWDLDAMEQLSSSVIHGRSQLPAIFKVSNKDRALPKEKFFAGMEILGRGMKKTLTDEQKNRIYTFLSTIRSAYTVIPANMTFNATNASLLSPEGYALNGTFNFNSTLTSGQVTPAGTPAINPNATVSSATSFGPPPVTIDNFFFVFQIIDTSPTVSRINSSENLCPTNGNGTTEASRQGTTHHQHVDPNELLSVNQTVVSLSSAYPQNVSPAASPVRPNAGVMPPVTAGISPAEPKA